MKEAAGQGPARRILHAIWQWGHRQDGLRSSGSGSTGKSWMVSAAPQQAGGRRACDEPRLTEGKNHVAHRTGNIEGQSLEARQLQQGRRKGQPHAVGVAVPPRQHLALVVQLLWFGCMVTAVSFRSGEVSVSCTLCCACSRWCHASPQTGVQARDNHRANPVGRRAVPQVPWTALQTSDSWGMEITLHKSPGSHLQASQLANGLQTRQRQGARSHRDIQVQPSQRSTFKPSLKGSASSICRVPCFKHIKKVAETS